MDKLPASGFDGFAIDQSRAAVKYRQNFARRIFGSKLGDSLSTGSVCRQIHAAKEGMASPSSGEFVGTLLAHKEIPAKNTSNFLLRHSLAPCEI